LRFSFASRRHKKRPQGMVALQPRKYVSESKHKSNKRNPSLPYHPRDFNSFGDKYCRSAALGVLGISRVS
jgi:hypothetical protein